MAKLGRDEDGEIGVAGVAGGLDAACKARKYGAMSTKELVSWHFETRDTYGPSRCTQTTISVHLDGRVAEWVASM